MRSVLVLETPEAVVILAIGQVLTQSVDHLDDFLAILQLGLVLSVLLFHVLNLLVGVVDFDARCVQAGVGRVDDPLPSPADLLDVGVLVLFCEQGDVVVRARTHVAHVDGAFLVLVADERWTRFHLLHWVALDAHEVVSLVPRVRCEGTLILHRQERGLVLSTHHALGLVHQLGVKGADFTLLVRGEALASLVESIMDLLSLLWESSSLRSSLRSAHHWLGL